MITVVNMCRYELTAEVSTEVRSKITTLHGGEFPTEFHERQSKQPSKIQIAQPICNPGLCLGHENNSCYGNCTDTV